MSRLVTLLHSVPKAHLDDVLADGLKTRSAFQDFGLEMRMDVVFCWLCREDDKMSSGGQRPDYVYVEVTVHEDRCLVADMDIIGLAMAYANGWSGKPVNPEAARLFAEAYSATAVPISEYTPGMFFTPEVLVKGDIGPEYILVLG